MLDGVETKKVLFWSRMVPNFPLHSNWTYNPATAQRREDEPWRVHGDMEAGTAGVQEPGFSLWCLGCAELQTCSLGYSWAKSKRPGQPSSHMLAHPTKSSTSNVNTTKILILCWASLVWEICCFFCLFQLWIPRDPQHLVTHGILGNDSHQIINPFALCCSVCVWHCINN